MSLDRFEVGVEYAHPEHPKTKYKCVLVKRMLIVKSGDKTLNGTFCVEPHEADKVWWDKFKMKGKVVK